MRFTLPLWLSLASAAFAITQTTEADTAEADELMSELAQLPNCAVCNQAESCPHLSMHQRS